LDGGIPKGLKALAALLIATAVPMPILNVLAQQTFYVYPMREYKRPLCGGLQIQIANNTHYVPCTLGYFVRDPNGNYGIITAGHCVERLWRNGNPTWVWVYQPNISSSSYLIGPNGYYTINGDIDAVFIPLNWDASFDPYLINITGPRRYGTVGILSYIDHDRLLVGTRVCKTGRTTGTTCGAVLWKENPHVDSETGRTYLDAVVLNVAAASGDSGSPVYDSRWAYYSGLPATALVGHLVKGYNTTYCTLTHIRTDYGYEWDVTYCWLTVAISVRAIRNVFGATICTLSGC